MENTPYSNEFYEDRSGSLRSARAIVPLILDLIQPKSVVDVGCGTGEFLHVFSENGVKDIHGIDGPWVNKEKLVIASEFFHSQNLQEHLAVKKSFDLALSLEVAEHLPETRAKSFVEEITNLAPVVLFSAAIPFQGGTHHVNEQWPEYWAELFDERGFAAIDCIRKNIWNKDEVSFWYSQNIILFVKKDHLEKNQKLRKEFEENGGHALALVHPKLFIPKAKKINAISSVIPSPIRQIVYKLRNPP